MIKLEKPSIDAKTIIEDCVSDVRKQPLLNHIKSSQKIIATESIKYDTLAENGRLSTLKEHEEIYGGATKDDMVWLYNNKFVSGLGRKYYDKIKAIPLYGKCPFCGVGRVSTLDHYLPKTKFPTYAVTPVNLVASCADCNKNKTSDVPGVREKEVIHPYYDDFNDEIWLKLRVKFEEEVVFKFIVEKPDNWNQEKYERAQNHFDTFRLNSLYIAHCGEEFSEYKSSAKKLYKLGGEELVKLDLEEKIKERRSVTKNNWRAALYEGLLNSEEFFKSYLCN